MRMRAASTSKALAAARCAAACTSRAACSRAASACCCACVCCRLRRLGLLPQAGQLRLQLGFGFGAHPRELGFERAGRARLRRRDALPASPPRAWLPPRRAHGARLASRSRSASTRDCPRRSDSCRSICSRDRSSSRASCCSASVRARASSLAIDSRAAASAWARASATARSRSAAAAASWLASSACRWAAASAFTRSSSTASWPWRAPRRARSRRRAPPDRCVFQRRRPAGRRRRVGRCRRGFTDVGLLLAVHFDGHRVDAHRVDQGVDLAGQLRVVGGVGNGGGGVCSCDRARRIQNWSSGDAARNARTSRGTRRQVAETGRNSRRPAAVVRARGRGIVGTCQIRDRRTGFVTPVGGDWRAALCSLARALQSARNGPPRVPRLIAALRAGVRRSGEVGTCGSEVTGSGFWRWP